MATDDGGPAFPILDIGNTQCEGMTTREFFASKADAKEIWTTEGFPRHVARGLMGCDFPNSNDEMVNIQWWTTALAKWKFIYADAMLAARGNQ
jgi:hypothetical protein